MTTDTIVSIVAGVVTSVVMLVWGVRWGQSIERRREEARNRETLEVRLSACSRVTPAKTGGEGGWYMAIELNLTNRGENSVYIKSLRLKSQVGEDGTAEIGFSDKAGETPSLELKPGQPYSTTYRGGLKKADYPPDWTKAREFELHVIQRVCKPDSYLEVVTSRGTHKFPASVACGADVEAWPSYFPPMPAASPTVIYQPIARL